MPELSDLIHDITNLYTDRTGNQFRRPTGLEEVIWERWDKAVPDSKFGEEYVKNRKDILDKMQKLRDWWEEEIDNFGYQVEEAVARVIEGSKEDIAYAAEPEREPDEVGEDELDDEEMWQWWGQEWHHNVDGKHWLTKHTKGEIDLQGVRRNGIEYETENIVDKLRGEGNDTLDEIENIIDEVDKTIEKPRIIKWAFGDADNPLEW